MSCHLDGWVQQKIYIYTVKASTHVTISVISRTLLLVDTSSFPSRYVCGLQLWASTLVGSKSAGSTNCPAFIFVTSLSGMGEYPGLMTGGLCNKEVTVWAKVVWKMLKREIGWWQEALCSRHQGSQAMMDVKGTNDLWYSRWEWIKVQWCYLQRAQQQILVKNSWERTSRQICAQWYTSWCSDIRCFELTCLVLHGH